MNFQIKKIDEVLQDYNQIKELYEESFPKTERFPFNYLLKQSKKDNVHLDIIYEEEKLIGISYIIVEGNFAFILYFAVNNKYRGSGYGTKIINYIKGKYNKYTILLEIEEVVINSVNYEQRLKRKSFYEKNGFYTINGILKEGKNRFELMSSNKEVAVNEKLFKSIFKNMFNGISKFFVHFYIKFKSI